MMPRATDGITDKQSPFQGGPVMTADSAKREHFVATAGQQHALIADMAREHAAIGKIVERDTTDKIRAA